MSLDLSLKNYQFNFKVANLSDNKIYEFEDFRLDAAQRLLYRNGEEVSLTPKAIETLLALVERRGEVVGKDALMQMIWTDTIVEESNLSQYLHVLRKTLGASPDGKPFIETLKRRGYRFNAAVRVSESASGFPARRRANAEETENFKPDESNGQQPKISDSRFRRVERRGNVLALADWRENEEKPDEIKTVIKQNDRRQSSISDFKSKSRLLFFAAALVLLAAFSFKWFKAPAAQMNSSTAKNELTILPLTNGETIGQATVSPDGKYFAYTEYEVEQTRLWLQQVGEANRVEIIEPFRGVIYSLAFAPDSKTIYFPARQKPDESDALYRVSTLGGVPAKILTGVDYYVSFSPDGKEFVFSRYDGNSSALVVASSDGARQRVLLTKEEPEIIGGSPAWSPDGRQIAFGLLNSQSLGEGGCSIVGFDLANETTKSFSAENWDGCDRMAWTPDGAGLVFVGTKAKESMTTRRDQIFYLALDAGEAHRLTADGSRHDAASLGVTDAGEILGVSYNRASQIWSLDASGDAQTARQITNGQSDGRGGIAALRDGRIAFLSRAGDGFGVFQTNADGENRRAIVADAPTAEELRASPDGRFFVFAAKADNSTHLFRADPNGANRRQLTFGASYEIDSTVSPDGNWIVYVSYVFEGDKYRFTLQKISSEGGAPVQLLGEECDTPHFSPDGKTIACVDGEKIRLISSETGEPLQTFETVKFPSLNMGARWTPDGQNLIYVVNQKNASNLWRQPISGGGGGPRPLTNFTNGEIYNFAFSTDGSRLYLARGNPIRNAILIKNFK